MYSNKMFRPLSLFLLFPLYFPDDWLSFLTCFGYLVEQTLSALMFVFLSFLCYTLNVLGSCLVFELVVLFKKEKSYDGQVLCN